MESNTQIRLRRAYEPAEAQDGFRIYVDRLWPRGLSHSTFHYDLWEKGVAPSAELRQWFHADPDGRWDEFCRRYRSELRANPAFAELRAVVAVHPVVTLLYSSHDEAHNNAIPLADALKDALGQDVGDV